VVNACPLLEDNLVKLIELEMQMEMEIPMAVWRYMMFSFLSSLPLERLVEMIMIIVPLN
jgi:hypothetical protein